MRTLLVLLATALLAVTGFIAAGPFLAIHGIREALERRDVAALDEHVDFPAVRASLRAQIEDAIARRAGPEAQADPLAALGLKLASAAAGSLADTLATPAGIAAVLEGRSVLRRLGSGASRDAFADVQPERWLDYLHYRFESPSRFVASVRNADGHPVEFVLTRDGLRWKVTDVRLPSQLLGTPSR